MEWFKNQGWQVDDAAPGKEKEFERFYHNHYDIDMNRNPFSFRNFKALICLHRLLKQNHYSIMHCHTPVGSVLARVAAIGIKNLSVIYTAHGFSFSKSSSLLSWALFFPIERFLRFKTDYLVTINNEDYKIAKRWRLAKKSIYKINGVGYRKKFMPVDGDEKERIKASFGLKKTDFIVLYTAQFIHRKNHQFIIECLPQLAKTIPSLKMVFVGNGELFEVMKNSVHEKGLDNYVFFMGGRSDVEKFCQMADIYISSSFLEGLCIGNVEAMACGLPLVLSDVRGQRDVCQDGRNGFLFSIGDKEKFINSIVKLYNDRFLRLSIRANNLEDVKEFSLNNALGSMSTIYLEVIKSCKNR